MEKICEFPQCKKAIIGYYKRRGLCEGHMDEVAFLDTIITEPL